MDTKTQAITIQPYRSFYFNAGCKFGNWYSNRGYSNCDKQSAVYVEPLSYADVQAVIRNKAQFPTPIRLINSLLSVTKGLINSGGTLLCTQNMDAILGLETDNQGRHLVRVQAGCRLAKLNRWLQHQGWEIPFPVDTDEATVGSVIANNNPLTAQKKWPHFPSHVVAILYINENGGLRILSDADNQDRTQFFEFQYNPDLPSIVVECVIKVQRISPTQKPSDNRLF